MRVEQSSILDVSANVSVQHKAGFRETAPALFSESRGGSQVIVYWPKGSVRHM